MSYLLKCRSCDAVSPDEDWSIWRSEDGSVGDTAACPECGDVGIFPDVLVVSE